MSNDMAASTVIAGVTESHLALDCGLFTPYEAENKTKFELFFFNHQFFFGGAPSSFL